MNKLTIFIAIMALASSTIVMGDEEPNYDELFNFKWPFLGNQPNNPANFIKKFQCGVSIRNVYACLRKSFIKVIGQKNNLLSDCCTKINVFHESCADFQIGKLEPFIFPPLLFKKCSATASNSDPSAPAPAPAPADGMVADDIQV